MILLAILAALGQASASSLALPPATVVGWGNRSCGDWSDAKQKDDWLRAVYKGWLGGFVSGLNFASQHGDITATTDFNGLVAWVDNYCAANPLDPVHVASANLAVTLRKLNRR